MVRQANWEAFILQRGHFPLMLAGFSLYSLRKRQFASITTGLSLLVSAFNIFPTENKGCGC